MSFGYSIYYVCLALSCIITATLGLIALQRRVNKGAYAFACLMFGAALSSFSYIFKTSSLSVYNAYFWLKVAYIGIVGIPVFWYIMIYQYTGAKNELTIIRVGRLFIIPSITILLLMTNSYHNLYYSGLLLVRPGFISMIYFEKGPWYWVQLIYSFALFISGYAQLIKERWYSDKNYRSRLGIFAIGGIVTWFINLLYLLNITPEGIYISTASYAIAGLIFAWGIYRYGIFDLIPIAHKTIFDTIQDGIIVLDLQNRVVDFNQKAQSITAGITGLEVGKLFNQELYEYFKIPDTVAHELCEKSEAKISDGNETNYFNCVLSPVLSKKRSIVGKTLTLQNITDQIKVREHLRTLATLDGLTNIYNRRHFVALCKKKLEQIESKAQSSAILLFDIDLFKNINDTFGHEAGDNVLRTVAEACAGSLRSTDIYARYGGEEFICLLPDTNSEGAFKIAECIRNNISGSTTEFMGNSIRITASFGVAGTDLAGNSSLEELIKMADKALYSAKMKGRNCTCLFSGKFDKCV